MIERGALPPGWIEQGLAAANPWPVTINAAGDIAGSDDTAPAAAPAAFAVHHAGGALPDGYGTGGAAPAPASSASRRPMVDQRVYERALFERDGLQAALALANLRAGLAEWVVMALCSSDGSVMNWREVDVPRAVSAILSLDGSSTTEEPLDTDDIHDLMNDAPGG